MATITGLLSINKPTHIIKRYEAGLIVDSYSISPDYQFIAVLLKKENRIYTELEKLQIFYINPAGYSEFSGTPVSTVDGIPVSTVSNNLLCFPNTEVNSFTWSKTGKWFILVITRNYLCTYLKYNTEIWKHAIQTGRPFNVDNRGIPLKLNSKPTSLFSCWQEPASKREQKLGGEREFNVTSVPLHWAYNPVHTVCEIIQESESHLTDDSPDWIASINILPAILDYKTRVMIDDKLLFFIHNDTTYKIYYLAGQEYTQLSALNNILEPEIEVGVVIHSFHITHNSSEVITTDDGTVGMGLQSHASGTPVPRNSRPLGVGLELSVDGIGLQSHASGIEYISNTYNPIFMSSTSNVFVYTTYINVYADKIEIIHIPKFQIPPVDESIIPMYIQEYPDDSSKIIIGHIQRNFTHTSNSYLIIDLVANTYESKELPPNLSCIGYYPSFNMAGPNTICMLEGPENNCVSYNLFTGEQHILKHIDTVSGFANRDTTYFRTGCGFGKTKHRDIFYRDVLDRNNWFRCQLGNISSITKASPDNSIVIICHSDKYGLSIQYTAKFCAEYNHGILANILSDELPTELIANTSKYSICE